MRAAAWGLACAACAAAPPSAAHAEIAGDRVAAALIAALPADGRTDVCLVDVPPIPRAPRVRCATAIAAPPATVSAVLVDARHFPLLMPSVVRSDPATARDGSTTVAWELEVPLFNLSGRLALRARTDGVRFELYQGDFSPGRIDFQVAARAGGGSALVVDAQLDIRHSSWLVRRVMSRSVAGEPAALAAATYVALRGTALRAEHPDATAAVRPTAPMAPPPTWPDAAPLTNAALAPLVGRGVIAIVARAADGRLAGVSAAAPIRAPPAAVEATLRDPATWRAFPGWKTIRPVGGARGRGAEVTDDIPLVDFDAVWTAELSSPPRWTATAGATRGARLGWTLFPLDGGAATLAALELYPRLEASGMVGRRFIAAEPLLESGLALGLAFADVIAVADALRPAPR